MFFQRCSNSAKSFPRCSMLARDQSRIPPGRSIRFTSSPVKGAYFARQVQKSPAILSRESVWAHELANQAGKKIINATYALFILQSFEKRAGSEKQKLEQSTVCRKGSLRDDGKAPNSNLQHSLKLQASNRQRSHSERRRGI